MDALIIDACRTPRGIGKAGKGALSDIHPQQLGAADDEVGPPLARVRDFDAATGAKIYGSFMLQSCPQSGGHLDAVARRQHDEPWHRAQKGKILHAVVRRSALTEGDAGQRPDDLYVALVIADVGAHKLCSPQRGKGCVGADDRNEPRRCHPRCHRHQVLLRQPPAYLRGQLRAGLVFGWAPVSATCPPSPLSHPLPLACAKHQ